MENTTTKVVPSLEIRIFGATSYALLSTVGLSLNFILIAVLVKNRSRFARNAFYTIAWQLVVCDVLTQFMEFLVPIPITFASKQVYGKSLLLYIPCAIDTVAYNGYLFFSCLMTINRFTVFIMPKTNRILFHSPRLYGWELSQFLTLSRTVCCLWLCLLGLLATHHVFACYKSFSSIGFHYLHACYVSYEETPLIGQITRTIFNNCSTYLPIGMFLCYVVMIVHIKIRTKETEHNLEGKRWSQEVSLLAQSFLICAFIEAQSLSFFLTQSLKSTGQLSILINIFGNWVSLLLCCIHPIVLFTFNQTIRSRLKQLFQRKTVVKGIQHSSFGRRSPPPSITVHPTTL